TPSAARWPARRARRPGLPGAGAGCLARDCSRGGLPSGRPPGGAGGLRSLVSSETLGVTARTGHWGFPPTSSGVAPSIGCPSVQLSRFSAGPQDATDRERPAHRAAVGHPPPPLGGCDLTHLYGIRRGSELLGCG